MQRFHADPHYVHKLMKSDYQEYGADSETDEKHFGHDKYLFPYTAEEDHAPPARVTNDVNNPGEWAGRSGQASAVASPLGPPPHDHE